MSFTPRFCAQGSTQQGLPKKHTATFPTVGRTRTNAAARMHLATALIGKSGWKISRMWLNESGMSPSRPTILESLRFWRCVRSISQSPCYHKNRNDSIFCRQNRILRRITFLRKKQPWKRSLLFYRNGKWCWTISPSPGCMSCFPLPACEPGTLPRFATPVRP